MRAVAGDQILKFTETENHEFHESTIYLESTANFITIRVIPPGLPEVGERRSPLKKEDVPPRSPQLKHWLCRCVITTQEHLCFSAFSRLENCPTVSHVFFNSDGKLFRDNGPDAENLRGPKTTMFWSSA